VASLSMSASVKAAARPRAPTGRPAGFPERPLENGRPRCFLVVVSAVLTTDHYQLSIGSWCSVRSGFAIVTFGRDGPLLNLARRRFPIRARGDNVRVGVMASRFSAARRRLLTSELLSAPLPANSKLQRGQSRPGMPVRMFFVRMETSWGAHHGRAIENTQYAFQQRCPDIRN